MSVVNVLIFDTVLFLCLAMLWQLRKNDAREKNYIERLKDQLRNQDQILLSRLNEIDSLQSGNARLRGYITAEREISQRFTDENANLRNELKQAKAIIEAYAERYPVPPINKNS